MPPGLERGSAGRHPEPVSAPSEEVARSAARPEGWPSYSPGPFFDEILGPDGRPRPAAATLWRHLAALGPRALAERQAAAEREIRAVGVTYTVYEDSGGVERPWPFDVIPRIMPVTEWQRIEAGLVQRLTALNLFIDDVYHDQRSLAAAVVPADLVRGAPGYHPECRGIDPPGGIWAHICGSDLVRDDEGTFCVLEDNLRVPSGASYLLENRMVTKHIFPELFRHYSIEPVDPYVGRLADLLSAVSPSTSDPTVVVLTPGIHNSAYFEHAFLALQLGVELVEGRDLLVGDDDRLYARTIEGLQRVDVVYRRIDDAYLDPEVFRADSLLGVPGLMRAWRSGQVALVNAPGSGIADDKRIYPFVPDIIRFFLAEDPILATVPTLHCADDQSRRYVVDNLEGLVMKPANEAGGTGVLVGTQATATQLSDAVKAINHDPSRWIAQPIVSLSTAPTLCDGEVVARHVDLRPFILLGPERAYVTQGGLTRVARRPGSLVVNSSQGGGSKDTWVVDTTLRPPRPLSRSHAMTSVAASVDASNAVAPPTVGPATSATGVPPSRTQSTRTIQS
ncbi:MAG: circularly permuted type 2 ATP-grasp protein [Acidimicrobiales bacterium]